LLPAGRQATITAKNIIKLFQRVCEYLPDSKVDTVLL
jgi:hypothetical protein